MDQKHANEDHWPLLADHQLADEERPLSKDQQSEPITAATSRCHNVRRAIACAAKGLVLAAVLLYLLIRFGRSMIEHRYTTPHHEDEFTTFHHEMGLFPYPHDLDDPRVICEVVNVTDPATLLKSLSFNLSTNADKIRVFARGPIFGNVSYSYGETAGDDIEVDLEFFKPQPPPGEPELFGKRSNNLVPAHYRNPPEPLHVKVCPFYAPGGGYNAVGIFASHHCGHGHPTDGKNRGPHGPPPPPPPPRGPHPPPPGSPPPPSVLGSIAIRFPKPSSGDRLEIHDFSSELAGFKHSIPTLDIAFTKLTLIGEIEAAGVGATELSVINLTSELKGNFSASKELVLSSGTGPIDVNVELWNSESEEGLIEPTKLTVVADRSYVRANVSLLTYPSETTKSAYIVKAVAPKDFISVNFTSQPLGSALHVETFSKDHPTSVHLHPAFEGRFAVSSVFYDPVIVVPEDTKDPYGEGRKRVVRTDKTWVPWTKKGSVEWVKEPDEDLVDEPTDLSFGIAQVTTVNAPAALILG